MRRDNDRNYDFDNSQNRYQGDRNREWHDYNRFSSDEYTQEPGTRHRLSQEQEIRQQNQNRQQGSYRPTQEDYYNSMYDTANYSAQPRHEDYGLYHGAEDELDDIRAMNLNQEGPYSQPRRYNYTQSYNPNYDNPEEGDMYRNFDSRGNHGYRHDASYGNEDEFRDFGNDHYGSRDRTNRPFNEEEGRYNRY